MKTYDYSEDPSAVEAGHLAQRRKLAELLMQQSVNGGPVYSNKAGIARALTGLIAGMDMGNAERGEKDLAQRRDSERRREMAELVDMATLQPTVGANLPQKDDEGNDMPGNVNQTAARRAQLAKLLVGSSNPNVANLAFQTATAKPKEEEAYSLAEGAKRYKGDKLIAENPKPKEPEKEPESVRTIRAEMKAAGIDPESEIGKGIFKAALTKATTHQPAHSVTVNTGKKFGETLATEVAQQVAQSAEAARGAVDTLNTAKQIESALASGKVMAGPGTTGIMWVQQAIGAPSTEEGRVQTRQVIQGLSQMTLAARKSLKGQGQVSDFEGKLLAKAASGEIDSLTIPEIQALTKTAARLANGSITQHQAYLKKIQSDPDLKGLAPFFDINAPAGGSNPAVDELLQLYGPKK